MNSNSMTCHTTSQRNRDPASCLHPIITSVDRGSIPTSRCGSLLHLMIDRFVSLLGGGAARSPIVRARLSPFPIIHRMAAARLPAAAAAAADAVPSCRSLYRAYPSRRRCRHHTDSRGHCSRAVERMNRRRHGGSSRRWIAVARGLVPETKAVSVDQLHRPEKLQGRHPSPPVRVRTGLAVSDFDEAGMAARRRTSTASNESFPTGELRQPALLPSPPTDCAATAAMSTLSSSLVGRHAVTCSSWQLAGPVMKSTADIAVHWLPVAHR